MADKRTVKQVANDKAKAIMDGVGRWCAYYRANPHRFAKEYLNLDLKDFQKLLLCMMEHNIFVLMICSRGIGKTWLGAVYITIRCILYPGTTVIIASGARGQATEVLGKIIDDLMKKHGWGSANLCNEISYAVAGQNNAHIDFKNGSKIEVVTANDNARSKRANIIFIDEYRMVDPMIIKTVLRRFNGPERTCGFHGKPEYRNYPKERNKEMYLSSAWMKAHWSYDKFKAYFADMFDNTKKYFCCAIPYQMSIRTNLSSREAVMDEMSEADFDPVTWSYEMESLFYGQTNGAFFDFEAISKRRNIKNAFYPIELYRKKDMQVPKLSPGERRILSVDIALMASTKHQNDASSLIINSAIPVTEDEFLSNIVYLRNYEGLTTDEMTLEIMRTFYSYNCTDLVVDINGPGSGVGDALLKDQYDPETGITYRGFQCVNDPAIAARCRVKHPNKCFWSMKATADINNEISNYLRSTILNGKINFLVSEMDAEDYFESQIKGFKKQDISVQTLYRMPHIYTSKMINELINLQHEIKNGKVRIQERSGMRKDMYSSLAYNLWLLREITNERKSTVNVSTLADFLASSIKKATRNGRSF